MRGKDAEADSFSYIGADSGCKEATEYLGYQSHCLSCPFERCIMEVPFKTQVKSKRNEDIRNKCIEGATDAELAEEYGISVRTVQRIVSGKWAKGDKPE